MFKGRFKLTKEQKEKILDARLNLYWDSMLFKGESVPIYSSALPSFAPYAEKVRFYPQSKRDNEAYGYATYFVGDRSYKQYHVTITRENLDPPTPILQILGACLYNWFNDIDEEKQNA